MSVANPTNGEVFTIVTQKYHTGNPSQKWVNTWEVLHDGTSDYATLVACKDAIVAFEIAMANTSVYIEKSRISTLKAETDYDPQSFVTADENLPGSITPSADPLDLRAAAFIRRQVQFGRQGKLFLRGYLDESSVESVAGEWSLVDQPTLNGQVQTALSSSQLADYMNLAGVPPAFSLVLASIKRTAVGDMPVELVQTRYVTGLEFAGVAWNKMSRNPRRAIP
jgi:hypothetical protein